MWHTQLNILQANSTHHHTLESDGNPLTFRQVTHLWQTAPDFRQFFNGLLQASPFTAYFWEVKPIVHEKLDTPFEFVLVNSSLLPNIKADFSSFREHFSGGQMVASFPNLGGDAQLIVPNYLGDKGHYGHLANFVRHAPPQQVDEFWRLVGEEYGTAIGTAPRWLSTAGLGVPWLHLRVDSRPKYYRYAAYKQC